MSDLLNNKYNIELEVLTPLHIGAGAEKDWMKGADYISDNNKVYILNHKKVLQRLKGGAEELSNFLLKKDDKGLKAKISGDLESVSDIIFNSPTGSEKDIKTFIKNGLTNKPIVPGSSLKGAIRSILLSYFIDSKNQIDRRNKRFEEEIFGSANKGDEFMRFIKIADAQFERTELINTKIFNLYGNASNLNGGWKHEFRGGTTNKFSQKGFNTIYEIIAPNETGELSIALSDRAFDNFYKTQKPKKKSDILKQKPSQKLFAIINEHAKKYIDKQIAFFKNYSNNETYAIISSLERVKSQIPNDNSACVLQMSAGSGFHSITGDWQFDDFLIDRPYSEYYDRRSGQNKRKSRGTKLINGKYEDLAKSRKIATDGEKFDLMGFVKLSILTEELMAEREAEKQAKLEKERIEEEERLAKEKAEKDRIEAKKQVKIEAERKAEADRLAKEKAEKDAYEKLEKEKAEKEKQAQEANQQAIDQITNQGYVFLEQENNFEQGRNKIEKFRKKAPIKEKDFPIIKSFVKRFFDSTKRDWKNFKNGKNWKKVISWVGKETAQSWYNEMIDNK